MSTELDISSYDSDSSSKDRPRYTILPTEWCEFHHFKADKHGRHPAYFYHQELRILTEEDIYDVQTLEQVLDYAEQHLEVLAEEGSLDRLPGDLELEIFGVRHPRSAGVAMYSYSHRKGFTLSEDGEIETHSNQMQFWQHVERFPVHRQDIPDSAEMDFRNALLYGMKALDFPYTNTQIEETVQKYNELTDLGRQNTWVVVVPSLIWLIAGFMKEIHDPLPLTERDSSIKATLSWQKYVNTVAEDALNKNKPRLRYYTSKELGLVTHDDLCDPKIFEAVLKIREDHLNYARAKGFQMSVDWEIEIFGVGHFDGPRVAIYSYSHCTLYDARTAAVIGAVRSFWEIIEKYPMHRTYIPRRMEHLFLRALIEDSSLTATLVQRIAARYWELKASQANGQRVVPDLVWLMGKSMTQIHSGEHPPVSSESKLLSTVKAENKPRLKKLSSSWKEYVNFENYRYFHNPLLRLITLGDMYNPEIYEITLKIREEHFQTLEEDGLMGRLPQDWEIIIFGQHYVSEGPYVAMCSYGECSKFLCRNFSPSQEAYWALMSNFTIHRDYIPEQLETKFLSALAESNSEALFPFTSQECQGLAQKYWELKAQKSIPALGLHVCTAMAKIEQSRELCDNFEQFNL